jgi:hypothetical protein
MTGSPRTLNDRHSDGWATDLLRVVGYGLTGALFCLPLGVPEAVGASAIGAAGGVLSARWLSRTPWHLWVWVVALGLGALGIVWLHDLVVAQLPLTQALEPTRLLRWSQAVLYGLMAWHVAVFLRLVSLR